MPKTDISYQTPAEQVVDLVWADFGQINHLAQNIKQDLSYVLCDDIVRGALERNLQAVIDLSFKRYEQIVYRQQNKDHANES